jgi:hypothetical protein
MSPARDCSLIPPRAPRQLRLFSAEPERPDEPPDARRRRLARERARRARRRRTHYAPGIWEAEVAR